MASILSVFLHYRKFAMKFVCLLLLIALGQTIHSAPVTDKSDEDRELDSWLVDIEQALDKEIPERVNIQAETDKGGPVFDRNEKMANREGPVDMEEWEEEVTNDGHNEEIEDKFSDDDLGYEPSDITDQSVDPEGDKLPQAKSKDEDVEQQFADNMAMNDDFEPQGSDSEGQEYWEDDDGEYKEAEKQQVDVLPDVNSNEMQELENYVNEPSHTSEDSWDDYWEDEWQDKPAEKQQGYYMEMAGQGNDKGKTDDSNESWEESNPNEDFDDLQFDDEFEDSRQPVDYSWEGQDLKEYDNPQFDDADYNGVEEPDVTAQQVDNSWEEPGPEEFDDLKFDNEYKKNDVKENTDPDVSMQSVDNWKEPGPKEFEDLQFDDDYKHEGTNPDINMQSVDDSWEEPGSKEFDDLQFDDEYKNEGTNPDINTQSVDDSWEEPGSKEFDDLQFDDELKEFNANSQSDDVNNGLGNKEQESWEPEYKNFDDLGVVEDVVINTDDIPAESVEPEQWAVTNNMPDDFQPEIMNDDQSDSVKG